MKYFSEEIEKFDSLSHLWWDKDGPFKSLHKLSPLRLDFILSNISRGRSLSGLKVLDIGCGGGIFCETLANNGFDVTGIDMSRLSIECAIDRSKSKKTDISYIVSNSEDISSSFDNYFDVVVCMELLEHVPNPEKVVLDCSRLVKNNGTVFFSTLNRNLTSFFCAIILAENFLGLLPKGMHDYENFITPYELYRFARSCSLFPKKISSIHYNIFNQSYSLIEDFSGTNYLFSFGKKSR